MPSVSDEWKGPTDRERVGARPLGVKQKGRQREVLTDGQGSPAGELQAGGSKARLRMRVRDRPSQSPGIQQAQAVPLATNSIRLPLRCTYPLDVKQKGRQRKVSLALPAPLETVMCVTFVLSYTASSPDSPVRMRITSSTGITKILPSPTSPV